MAQVEWSPRSIADLGRIQTSFDAIDEVAQQVVRPIRAATIRLVDHPRLGTPIGNSVRILRIRHIAEDWRP